MKLMKIMLAVLVMAAMVTPVIAEDRLDLSGSMQVRGFYYNYDSDEYDDDGGWNDQRLRIMGKVNVADGVKVVFRFDATESNENSSDAVAWGGSQQAYTDPPDNTIPKGGWASAYQYSNRRADIQFDLAYLELQKNGFTFQAGQNYFNAGGYVKIVDMVGAGFKTSYKGFHAMHMKRKDQNQGNDDFSSMTSWEGDASLTAVSYNYKSDAFSLTPIIAYNADKDSSDEDFWGLALAGSANLGPVALKGEFDYFTGEDGESNVDMDGQQLYLDASMAATDALRIGLMGFYAKGQEDDRQVTDMNKYDGTDWAFADYQPAFYGPWSSDFTYFSGQDFDIFDPSSASAGVVAASLYADWKLNEDIDFAFAGLMWETEDDSSDGYDADGYTLNASIVYKLMSNTKLSAHVNYQDTDWKDDDFDEQILQVISGLVVSF